jgi:hypothetical protein
MDYAATITVAADPATAARAIPDDLALWWSTRVDRHANGFTIRFNNSHVRFETDRGGGPEKFTWTCTDANMIIAGVADAGEWRGTRAIWHLRPQGTGTAITLTHQGLVPEIECHQVCVAGWRHYFEKSLRDHLNGLPGSPERSTAMA